MQAKGLDTRKILNAIHTCKTTKVGDWRSGSATPLHGEGRRFNPVIAYHYTRIGGSNPSSRTRITWVLAGEKNIGLAVDVKTKTVQVRNIATFGLVSLVTYPNT